jgi:hypothetical protein
MIGLSPITSTEYVNNRKIKIVHIYSKESIVFLERAVNNRHNVHLLFILKYYLLNTKKSIILNKNNDIIYDNIIIIVLPFLVNKLNGCTVL